MAKRKSKMPTKAELRSIVREMRNPPHNARRRPALPQTKLVTRKRGENPPRSGKVTVSRGLTRTQRAVASATRERPGQWTMPPKPRTQRPSATPTSKPKPQKPRVQPAIRTRARAKGGRLFYTPTGPRKRIIGMDIRVLPELVNKGIITQSEANAIRNAAEGRRGVNYNLPVSARDTSNILKRDLNLTPSARARLDAEEARLAREAERSASLQLQESRRNRRVQNPLTESRARQEVERRVAEGLRAIEKAERKQKKLQRKQPSRPIAPRTSTGGMIPMAPGAGGGGLISRIR